MNSRLLTILAMGAFAGATGTVRAEDAGAKSGVVIDLDQPPPGAPKKAAPPATPGPADRSKSAGRPDQKKKPADPPKIEGMEVSRGDRGFLGVKIESGMFKLSFYDKDRKPVAADVAGAALRWPVHYQPNDERALLAPTGDGKALTSEKFVRPPYSFKLFIVLLKDLSPGADPSPETYVVDFRG